jgi:hypothetical protein
VPVSVGRTTVVDAVPPAGGYVSATAAVTHANVAVLYACPDVQVVQAAVAVLGFVHTGVAAVQSAPEAVPELPRHAGVAHAPVPTLHACPDVHCASSVHATTSVPVLVAPALVATTVNDPSGRFAVGVQVQVDPLATTAMHAITPFAVTTTVCPGTPVPAIGSSRFVVLAVPPAGGVVRATAGATHRNEVVL